MKIVTYFQGCNKGHQGFCSIPFNYLEGQAAPQNSFVSIRFVVSIPTALPIIPFASNNLPVL